MISKWRSVFVVGILAAIFTAIYKSMDNITVHNFIIADEDELTAALTYLVVGGWTGALFSFLFAVLFGKRLIDPDFCGIVFRNKTMHIQAGISGAISAGSTLFLLWGNQKGDPSVLIALGNAALVYIVAYDVLTGHLSMRTIAIPAFLVFAGAGLTAFNGLDNMKLTLFGLLFVIVISNGLGAVSTIVEQKGVRASNSVNLFVWRFLWLAVTGTMIAVASSVLRSKTELQAEMIADALPYIPWITLTMFFVFLGIGLKFFAMKDNTITVITLIVSIQMVAAFPITLVGDAVHPGLFGEETPRDGLIWMVRIVGAGLMVWGIYQLRKTQERERVVS